MSDGKSGCSREMRRVHPDLPLANGREGKVSKKASYGHSAGTVLFVALRVVSAGLWGSGAAVGVARTYTVDADFDGGTLVGVEHDTVHHQLQLS